MLMTTEERLDNIVKVIADIIKRGDYSLYDKLEIHDLICNHEWIHSLYGYSDKYKEWVQCEKCHILKPKDGWIGKYY